MLELVGLDVAAGDGADDVQTTHIAHLARQHGRHRGGARHLVGVGVGFGVGL